MNFNQTPTRIGMAAKFTRTYSSSLCRSPTRCASLSQFSEALFFLLFMFLRLTRGWAASCVGVVTGLAFFIFFSSELPPPRLACVSARKFLELSACLIHAGASCINQTCLCRGLLFLFLRLPWSWSRKCDRAGWVLIRDPPTNKQACEDSKRGLPVNRSSCHVSFWRRSRLLMMQFFLRVAPTNKLCTFVASSGAERELFEVWGEDERWVRVF